MMRYYNNNNNNNTNKIVVIIRTITILIMILSTIMLTMINNNDIHFHVYSLKPVVTTRMTQVQSNQNFRKLNAGYLFPEIARRRDEFMKENPHLNSNSNSNSNIDEKESIISLGIGDTTEPIPEYIATQGLMKGVTNLMSRETYTGYGAEKGLRALRDKIAKNLYGNIIDSDEVFVSDGAKCDIARLQMMFGSEIITAVQDPSYPVYVDTAVMMGQTGEINPETAQYKNIVYMKCDPSNSFFPDLESLPKVDVIHFCSPNNPTGATATREQLTQLVNYALEKGIIIVFDAAYAPFVQESGFPKSIFEIPGARECAIEVNSFSKYAGFTGVRLGWTIIPKELKFADGTPVSKDFNRVMTTCFNGASNIAQSGGMAILDERGQKEMGDLISYYMENTKILREAVEGIGLKAYGGTNCPYVFADCKGLKSWDIFEIFLKECHIVTVPGAGFGPGGEGFLRLSGFASRKHCIEAKRRMIEKLKF